MGNALDFAEDMKKEKGSFIVIEGLDGSGKGTVIERLKKELPIEQFHFTREPGGTTFAEEIRKIALDHPMAKHAHSLTLFYLMWASRREHVHEGIRPELYLGRSVICDRFDASTYSYQIVGQGMKYLEDYFWQTRTFVLEDVSPDAYVFLDVSPEEAKKRSGGRGEGNHFDQRKLEFHAAVREGFLSFFSKIKKLGTSCITIDAHKSPDEVYAAVLDAITKINN